VNFARPVFVEYALVAGFVSSWQGRFCLWILWKIRPEFHTRKPLVQNSKRAFYQQNPQALLAKPYTHQKSKVGLVRKTKVKTNINVGHDRHKRTVSGGHVTGRAHLHVASQHRILDNHRGIFCLEDVFKTFSKRGCP